MTEKPLLGRLESVDLREGWPHEAIDFTPWLSEDENIRLLGEALDLDLEAEGREVWVGPFRADILARDRTSDVPVLIENQLEGTDHNHLGAIMTYAAGLDAAHIVWVARAFVEQHRAALDWLNRVTVGEVNFFGVEIELWRIGDSAPAPKFNVVSKPNQWSKQIRKATSDGKDRDKYQEFWTGLAEAMEQRNDSLSVIRPARQSWLRTPTPQLPRSIWVNMSYKLDTERSELYLLLYDSEHPGLFEFVSAKSDLLGKAVGRRIDWGPDKSKEGGSLGWFAPESEAGEGHWAAQYDWLIDSHRRLVPALLGVFKEYESTQATTA